MKLTVLINFAINFYQKGKLLIEYVELWDTIWGKFVPGPATKKW